MTAFNVSTSYGNDWEFMDLVVSGTLRTADAVHVRTHSPGSRDWTFIADAMGITSQESIAQVWPTDPAETRPEIDDQLTLSSVVWVITQVTDMQHGPGWNVAIVRASSNA